MGFLTVFPFTHSVARELEAMAEPHPNVLNLASTILPCSSTLIWRNQLFVKIYNTNTNIFLLKWPQGFSFLVSLEANYTIVRARKNVNCKTRFHWLLPEKKNISHHAESHHLICNMCYCILWLNNTFYNIIFIHNDTLLTWA